MFSCDSISEKDAGQRAKWPVWAHVAFGALVDNGMLFEHKVSKGSGKPKKSIYTFFPPGQPKRVVRAGYVKLKHGWGITCSEHGQIAGNSTVRSASDYAVPHFEEVHEFDQIEWDDPPKKVEITFERGKLATRFKCTSGHYPRYGHWSSAEDAVNEADRHVRLAHPDDDVTFGPLPEPPHKHSWRWGHLGQICCAGCDVYFHEPEPGTPYTGPVPEHLQDVS